MIVLKRAMSDSECRQSTPFSFNSRYKWFGINDFTDNRVKDGFFNNSHIERDRYKRTIVYVFENVDAFSKVSDKELMLDRRKVPIVKLKTCYCEIPLQSQ